MTTTSFTEAARAEAERRHPAPEIETGAQLGYTQTEIREVVRRTFTNAAEWARTHIVAQAPTDAEKDAAMDALGCELRVVENGQSTCDLHGGYATSDDVCEVVEVALSAARAARRDEEKRNG